MPENNSELVLKASSTKRKGSTMKIYAIEIKGRLFQTFNKHGVAITTMDATRALIFWSWEEVQDVIKVVGGEAFTAWGLHNA